MGRHDRAQLRPEPPRPPDDRHAPLPQGVRAAHPPLPGQGPHDRHRRALRARRVQHGHGLADPAHPGPRRDRLEPRLLRALPGRLRGRLHHRARGPALRGHRREGQAGLPDRPRRPPSRTASSPPPGRSPMALSIADLTERDIAKTIDHSLLRPELDDAFVEAGCRLAAKYDVASVCVRPADVRAREGDPRRDGRQGRDDHRLPARQPHDRDQGRRGAPGPRGRRHRAGHGPPDRRPQVRPGRRTSRTTSGPSWRWPTPPGRSSR